MTILNNTEIIMENNQDELHPIYSNNPNINNSTPYMQGQNPQPPPQIPQFPPKQKKSKKVWKSILYILLVVVISVSSSYATYILTEHYYTDGKTVFYESVIRDVADASEADKSLSNEQVAELVSNSVVEITTESASTSPFYPDYIESGAGSGVILSKDGYIITNHHVIEDAANIAITLKNGQTYEGKLIGSDKVTDLAVVKINAEEELTPVIIGDSNLIKVGQNALVVGNPLGELGGSVTSGIISALDREIAIENELMTLLQIDAAVNPGNSGGGVFNNFGELIGVVNAKSSGEDIEGIGFAIPINTVKKITTDLIDDGFVNDRITLGVSLADISSKSELREYGLKNEGVYIIEVTEESLAEYYGLQPFDRIISIDSKIIQHSNDAVNQIRMYSPNDTFTVTIDRDGEELEIEITAWTSRPTQLGF